MTYGDDARLLSHFHDHEYSCQMHSLCVLVTLLKSFAGGGPGCLLVANLKSCFKGLTALLDYDRGELIACCAS